MKNISLSIISCVLLFSTWNAAGQDTRIRFFGQPGFEYNVNPSQDASSPYFRGGPLVLFATSQLGERFSVAGELHAHYMHTTGAEVEIERIYVRYFWKDYMSFRFGRMYTPIGYWNQNYNFGLILQPTIGRPKMLQPVHDGGFISTRDTGFMVEGEEITKGRIFYKVLIGNGLGRNGGYLGTPYNLGHAHDLSPTIQIGFEPTEGLKLSVSGNWNDFEAGDTDQFGNEITEDFKSVLFGTSISFMNPDRKFEFISEYFVSTNKYAESGNKKSPSAFLYTGYKASNKVVPYLYIEWLRFDESDTFYHRENIYTEQVYTNSREFNVGVRYRANPNVVLKLEASALHQELYGWTYGPRFQAAFGF
jgi:hypothetical protein